MAKAKVFIKHDVSDIHINVCYPHGRHTKTHNMYWMFTAALYMSQCDKGLKGSSLFFFLEHVKEPKKETCQ